MRSSFCTRIASGTPAKLSSPFHLTCVRSKSSCEAKSCLAGRRRARPGQTDTFGVAACREKYVACWIAHTEQKSRFSGHEQPKVRFF